ncbi:MAG: hypothetical protein AUI14_01575 [Actinobacteria bacterium 13_2_20CM_2_71_6]|nr:MAG: hypothetical protein AUI14_01575 [Actinobacteria bacterium 13_2_20CM_2_71_6]
MNTRTLCTPDTAEVSREVAGYVRGLAWEAALTNNQTYRLRLAAEEIATNIVLHGYHGKPGLLEISGGVEQGRVWLRIEDEAAPFDPRTHDPGPRLDEGLLRGRAGGFGLFLALRSLDEFAYENVDGRNRNTLIVRRPRPDQVATDTETDGGHDGRECRAGRG